MKRRSLLKLIIAVGICELVGLTGSLFTVPSIPTWYAVLNKPFFSPPSWLFGPVWTILYALMGVSVWLFVSKTTLVGRLIPKFDPLKRVKRLGLFLFALQLALNLAWSYVFFGLREIGWAFFELMALWAAIAATAYYFEKVSKRAALLLIPYLLWVTFAGALNFSLWGLNEGFWTWKNISSPLPVPPSIETPLPTGYLPNDYIVEEVTGQSCSTHSDCETPVRYLVMSRCPFVSRCIAKRCAVVCPRH